MSYLTITRRKWRLPNAPYVQISTYNNMVCENSSMVVHEVNTLKVETSIKELTYLVGLGYSENDVLRQLYRRELDAQNQSTLLKKLSGELV